MAKNFIGYYNTMARKVIKRAEKLTCQVTDDGKIFVSNGHYLFQMTAEEYAAVVQPVSCCEAGSWTIDQGEKKQGSPDFARVYRDAVRATEAAEELEAAPMIFPTGGKQQLLGMYSAAKDFVTFYDADYIGCIMQEATFRAAGPLQPVVAYMGVEPIAMILPVRPKEQNTRAVKAYFGNAAQEVQNQVDPGEVEKLRAQLAGAQAEATGLRTQLGTQSAALDEARAEAAELKTQLDLKIMEIEDAQENIDAMAVCMQQFEEERNTLCGWVLDLEEKAMAAREAKPGRAATAEAIAAQWQGVEGIAATVKGAKTAKPIVWLSGAVKAHAKEIEANGGKWSAKKSAYYFNVA